MLTVRVPQGCRNLANPGGGSLSGLPALHGLTALCMRGCDRLTGAPAVWTSSLSMACKGCLHGWMNSMLAWHLTVACFACPSCPGASVLRRCLPACQPEPTPRPRACFTADGALGFLTALSTLQHLDLSGCKELSPAGLSPLSALSSLESLKLQHCTGLRGPAALSALSALARLSALNLGGCTGIYGQALRALRCALCMMGCTWVAQRLSKALITVCSMPVHVQHLLLLPTHALHPASVVQHADGPAPAVPGRLPIRGAAGCRPGGSGPRAAQPHRAQPAGEWLLTVVSR